MIIFTDYFIHLFPVNAVNRGELLIFNLLFEPLDSCIPPFSYSTAPTVNSCEFKSGSLKVGTQIRLNCVRKAVVIVVSFCKNCGELDFFPCIHGFHHISYINLPQKSTRRIFVRTVVNFAVNF